jgi:membrane-associated phospholipid phosphatase
VLLALPYLCHFAIPWVFCVYLLYRRRSPFPFLFTIGLLNLVAVCTQLLWPTAPPWWVEKHGPEVPTYDVPSNAGRLLRIDELLGVDLFRGMYGVNPVVFGSFPSLHSAWPLLIALYAVRPLAPRYRFLYPMWVWLAAIYLKHHFVVDVVFGILYTLATAYVSARLVRYLWPSTPTLYSLIMIESIEREPTSATKSGMTNALALSAAVDGHGLGMPGGANGVLDGGVSSAGGGAVESLGELLEVISSPVVDVSAKKS